MAFHLFHINEIYSNADGSIQFVELVGDADGQPFLAGHTLTVTQGGTTNTFSFTTNLPSTQTLNKSVLIATQGFADLGIVAPNYIIPAGFLFTSGGTLTFAEGIGGTPSIVTYGPLPTGGLLSVNQTGVQALNTPTNFAGVTATTGTPGPDNITGTAGADNIFSLAGNDSVTGEGGDDVLDGGDDADLLVGDSLNNAGIVLGSGTFNRPADLSNDSLTTALVVPTNLFSLAANPDIAAATVLPHVSVVSPSDNGNITHFYRISLTAGQTVFLDVDSDFDGAMTLYNPSGTAVANGDQSDFTQGGGGTNNFGDDPYIVYTATATGTYYVEIGEYGDGSVLDGNQLLNLIQPGDPYTLHISLLAGQSGAGNDALVGGEGSDTLIGGAGNDTLTGGGDEDVLLGGDGNDIFVFNDSADVVWTELILGGPGTDQLRLTGDIDFSGLVFVEPTSSIEQIYLAGTANGVFSSNQFSTERISLSAEFISDGGGVANTVTITLGFALDFSAAGFTFSNWDAADLFVINGNDDGNDITGSSRNDSIVGGILNDTLNGGAGADQLRGALGNDTYHVDTQADLVFEGPGDGIDTVISSVSFYLYDNVENLTLAAGAGNLFGSANASNNTLTGNEGGNLLIGWDGNDIVRGGAGNDVLYGVNNDDSLFGEAGIDVLVAGEGNDTLDGGADPDELYGENGNDVLYGGSGFVTDILVGGAGNDTLDGSASVASGQPRNAGDFDYLYGQLGDDTYYVDTPSDLTFEFNGLAEGTDTVIADITGAGYYLYDSTENLILTGNTAFGVGNGQNNQITGSVLGTFLLGGGGNDTLNGKQGNDVLFGEAGADTFVFERGTNADVIGDFTPGVDKIQLIGIGYNSFAQVQPHLVQNGGTTAIDLGAGDLVVLNGVAIASLSAGDFLFA